MNDARRIMLMRMRASRGGRRHGVLLEALHEQDVVICWRLRQAEQIIDDLAEELRTMASLLVETQLRLSDLEAEAQPWPSPWIIGPPPRHH